MKKAIISIITAFILLGYSECAFASASVSAKSSIVIDAQSGRVLYEKNAYERRGMASTTKIMTALVALERLDLSSVVTVSPHAAGTEGSSIWLSPLEKISVYDLLYGLMLASGNDAASALAEHTAGSEDAFAIIMNARAKKIGAYNTNFTNPHGLPDENHYTTAYDLAIISAEAMRNPDFAEIVSQKQKTISWEGSRWDRSLRNHNKLLNRYQYAIGIKTGYTKKDGRCLVSCAEKDGRRLICVTLNAPDDWNDHIALHEYCFEKFVAYKACSGGESAGIFKNINENADDINLVYEKDFTTSLTNDEAENIKIEKVFNVKYPVTKNQIVGRADILCKNEKIGSINLIAANDAVIKKEFISVLIKLAKGILRL